MEQLKNIGNVCRQHYEKLILIGALILLAGAVWYLWQASQEEKDKITKVAGDIVRTKPKPVPPVNVAELEHSLKDATNATGLAYSGKHNLFNPVKWQQLGGRIIKVETGK